jgi:NADH-quinone oxidoreductase subunit J
MSSSLMIFDTLAAIAILASLYLLIFSRRVMTSILCLMLVMASLSGLFVQLGANFVGIIQLLVYTNTLLLLLFLSLMLPNLKSAKMSGQRTLGGALKGGGAVLVVFLSVLILASLMAPEPLERASIAAGLVTISQYAGEGHAIDVADTTAADGPVSGAALGGSLLSDFFLPFEVLSLILFAGIVGAVVLSRPRVQSE